MWKRIKNSYFIAFTPNLEFIVTDFVSVWFNQFTNSSFLACLKESNFDMEIEEEELIKKGTRMLRHPNELKKADLKKEGNSLVIVMSVMYGCPIRLSITLTAGSKELFFQKVTQPLLLTINDLKSSQNKLRVLLQKKDTEIEEYKCEGGEIALRCLKTIPFNDEVHMKSHCTYEKQFGSAFNIDELVHKRVSIADDLVIQAPNSVLKPEPTATMERVPTSVVKEEPSITVKLELPTNVKQEDIVKSEPQSESLLSMVSPRKKQKRKLNI